ncbi:hypothetical protein M9H77_03890 [Catharanthus roseus]|uniref:Uncharacterized protein n=1 Tax=Catharanthus roseus TaxID=4058 RepID=A0ACC0CCT0_CATRO|nr:hypothetical protein M9H77_03890 [Catharanthus roseus]
MLSRFTLDLDPIDRGCGTVVGLVVCAVVYEKSNVHSVCFMFQADNMGPLDSVILGSSTSSHKVLICEDLGTQSLQSIAERHAGTLPNRY